MGVAMWVVGVSEIDSARRTVIGDTHGPTMTVFVSQPGEHLAGCVRRAAEVGQTLAEAGAAVGMAVGPVVLGHASDATTGGMVTGSEVDPTTERARRALAWAQPGDVILAWGSQAYLSGEFASAATGFVRLVRLA